MKKLIIIALVLLSPSFLFAMDIFGKKEGSVNNNGGVIMNMNPFNGGSNSQQSQAETKAVKESYFNVDFDLLHYQFPHQPADSQFVQNAYSVGTTYKFSDLIHAFGKYSVFSVSGDSAVLGSGSTINHEHLIVGAGASFRPMNDFHIYAQAGMPLSSTVTESNSGASISVKDALLTEIRFMKMYDNFGIGIVWSNMRTKWDSENDTGTAMPGGFEYLALTIQVGLPQLQDFNASSLFMK